MRIAFPAALLLLLASDAGLPSPAPAELSHQQLRFVPNRGQWDPAVEFAAIGGGGDAWLLRDGFAFRFQRTTPPERRGPAVVAGAVLRTVFEGAAARELVGERPLSGRHNFLFGAGGDRFVRDVPAYSGVVYRGAYPGIDMRVRPLPAGGREALFEYDLLLSPGAELNAVVVRCEGAERLALDPDGSLTIGMRDGDGRALTLRQLPPVAFQKTADGVLRNVPCAFRILDERRFGFSVEGWDRQAELLVDPGVVWSTYLGGGSSDAANAMRWVPGNGIFVGGFAGSSDFPTTTGAFRTVGQRDAFVSKLSEDGTRILWSTYLGGNEGEEVRALDVDGSGNVTVVGWTVSSDFPITAGAFQNVYRGGSAILATGDAFVTRLRADGAVLLGSTFLGGTFDEVAEAVDVDAGGTATVVGWSASLDFPVTPGALQPTQASPFRLNPDGFIARIAGDGRSAAFVTYLGGFLRDELYAVHVTSSGEITVAGYSDSADYPTSINAFRTTLAGSHDAVVTRLNAQGNAIVWSTYLGGAGHDRALALDRLADGSVAVGGTTLSANFPASAGAVQTALSGVSDGFVALLSPNGTTLPWATYLGGNREDVVRALAVDGNGDVLAVGETQGGFPTTAMAPQSTFGGGVLDGFLARLDQGGTVLGFSTYLGGSADDVLAAVNENAGLATVAGWTWSTDWPATPGSVQTANRGSIEACVAQVDLLNRLEGALVIGGGELTAGEFAAGATMSALKLLLDNRTPRPIDLVRLRCFLGGTGDNPRDLAAIRLFWDRDGDGIVGATDVLIAGPMAPAVDNAQIELPVTGMTVPAGVVESVVVELEALPQCAVGAEFAASVTDRDAWEVRAVGAGPGPTVVISGEEFVQGPAMACQERVVFSGDANGDGAFDARDLRGLAMQLGEPAAGVDPDGDGTITQTDLILLQDRILDRPVVLSIPVSIQPGVALVIGGYGLMRSVVATLGGRVLPRLSVTDRELSFAVDSSLPSGSQTLILDFGGRVIVQTPIIVP